MNEDLKILYGGYALNGFDGLMPPGMKEHEFVEAFLQMTAGFNEIIVGLAPMDKGSKKLLGSHQIVGIAGVSYDGHRASSQSVWMPWASKRNKLEVSACFFREMRKRHLMLSTVKMEDKVLFLHMCRLGLMRHVGHIDGYYPDGEPASLFHTLEIRDV